jgi:hypothetical protein
LPTLPPPPPSPSYLTLILMLEFQRIYCATNSSSFEVELGFCPWLLLFKYYKGLVA